MTRRPTPPTLLLPVVALALGALPGCTAPESPPESPGLYFVGLAVLAAFGATAFARRRASPVARPLWLLCADLAVWNASQSLWSLSPSTLWHAAASGAAALLAPLAAHVTLTFTGHLQTKPRVRAFLAAGYVVCGAWAAVMLALRRAPFGDAWHVPGVALLLSGAACLAALIAHLRRVASAQEEVRTRLVLAALALGAMLGLTEFSWLAGLGGPRLGALAGPAGAGLVALVALRLRAGDRDLSTLGTTYGTALGACGVVAYLVVFQFARAHPWLLAPGTVAVTLALLLMVRGGVTRAVVERQRLEQLATLGRFAAQMAHDLKNPLAALKGAAQFLKEEHARKGGDDGDFLELILHEIDRMHRVVDNYQRLGRVEAVRSPGDVNELVRGVMALQGFAGGAGVSVRALYAEGLPRAPIDEDLLTNALTNLVRNAFEAMPQGGALVVRTGPSEPTEAPGVVITVEDTGVGMDALTRERAMESFYTTKAQGSGLGLAFVRRVVEAHEGELFLTSREGLGTIARVRLPTA